MSNRNDRNGSESSLTRFEAERLAAYDPDGWTDGLYDQNFANRMEAYGLLVYKNATFTGRCYEITEKGRQAISHTFGEAATAIRALGKDGKE